MEWTIMAQQLFAQDSNITLYKNVEITSQHELTFSSEAAQTAYFNKRAIKTVDSASYIYHEGMLKISGSPSLLGQCNYISFTNPTLDGKTIYAAVSDVIYVNNETVKIPYVIDWWQTFMFDAKYLPCQMARESVEAGIMEHATRGEHPLLDTRVYRTNNSAPERWYYQQDWTWDWGGSGKSFPSGPKKPTDCYIVMAIAPFIFDADRQPDLSSWINGFTATNATNAINNFHRWKLNIQPSIALGENGTQVKPGDAYPNGTMLYCMDPTEMYPYSPGNKKIFKPGTYMDVGIQLFAAAGKMHQILNVYYLPGYVLRSLFTPTILTYDYKPWYKEFPFNSAPYSYLGVTGPHGNLNLFQYELFNHYEVKFKLTSSFAGNFTSSLIPMGYRGLDLDFDNRIDIADFPQVPYNVDGYLETMGQVANTALQAYARTNSVFSEMDDKKNAVNGAILNTAAQAATSLASGNVLGLSAVVGGAMDIGSKAYDAYIADQSNQAALNWASGRDTVDRSVTALAYGQHRFVPGSASALYKETKLKFTPYMVVPTHDVVNGDRFVYDNYGMETPRVGLPYVLSEQGFNTGGRPYYNNNNPSTTYVQTKAMHCYGLPVLATNFINQMFNSGITFIKGDGR